MSRNLKISQRCISRFRINLNSSRCNFISKALHPFHHQIHNKIKYINKSTSETWNTERLKSKWHWLADCHLQLPNCLISRNVNLKIYMCFNYRLDNYVFEKCSFYTRFTDKLISVLLCFTTFLNTCIVCGISTKEKSLFMFMTTI